MDIYISRDFLVKMDSTDILALALVASELILQTCKENSPEQWEEKVFVGFFGSMKEQLGDVHLTNILLVQVNLLYEITRMLDSNSQNSHYLLYSQIEFVQQIVKALREFQQWKTRICEYKEEKYGKGFGTRTGFYQMDWTDHIESILSKHFK